MTPYLVKVRNDGPSDFAGEVVLVPGSDSVPTFPSLTGYFPPAPPEWPTYRMPVSVAASGGEKALTTMVVEAPGGYGAEVRSAAGRIVVSAAAARPKLALWGSSDQRPAVVVLSRIAGGDARLKSSLIQTGRGLTVTQIVSSSDFPDEVVLLSGVTAVVVDDADGGELSPAQLRALKDFVGLGGGLVLGGGASWSRTLAALPDELVPLRPTATAEASVGPIADLGGLGITGTAPVAVGEIRHGRAMLQFGADPPLVVESDYGAGHIVQLAYDPFAEPFASDKMLASLAWEQGLARGLVGGFQAGRGDGAMFDLVDDWRPSATPSWPGWGYGILGAYALVVGPLAFLILRSRRRFGLSWVAVPLTASVFMGGSALTDLAAGSADDFVNTSLRVHTVGTNGTVLVNSYQSIGASRPASLSVQLPPGTFASTVAGPPQKLMGVGPGSTATWSPPPGSGGGVVVSGYPEPSVEIGRLRMGDVRTLQTMYVRHDQVGLVADLRVSGPFGELGEPKNWGFLTGTVTNQTGHRIRNLRVHKMGSAGAEHYVTASPAGVQAHIAEVIEPGQAVQVSVPIGGKKELEQMVRIHPPPSPVEERAMEEATHWEGHASLVGLMNFAEPNADPASGIDVLVQKVRLGPPDVKYGPTREVSKTRTVSAFSPSGGSYPDWVQVVEMELPPATYGQPVRLDAFARAGVSADVYDWRSETWRALPMDSFEVPDPTTYVDPTSHNPLTVTEVDRGRIRVRARTPGASDFRTPIMKVGT